MTIRRTLGAALVITAIAAPAATAQPPDMHASTAQAQHRQDMRSADAIDAAQNPRRPNQAETISGGVPVAPVVPAAPVAPGQPTWPTNPKPIAAAPAVETTAGDDGVDWGTIGLGIAGTLLALGGIVALTKRGGGVPRARASV